MIISIFNQKGGCGKSTTTTNLGAYLALQGKRVLLVDSDAQANTTVSVGIDDEELEKTILDLLMAKEFRRERTLEVLLQTSYERLHILPSDALLASAEMNLVNAWSRELVMQKVLSTIKDLYDYIIIDCPPALGLLSINALVAADALIIPALPDSFNTKAIKNILDTYNQVKSSLNPELEIMGVLITKYNPIKNLARETRKNLIDVFGEKVFNTVIRVDSKIEYSQDEGKPIFHYCNKCHAYEDYTSLGEEVLAWGRKQ